MLEKLQKSNKYPLNPIKQTCSHLFHCKQKKFNSTKNLTNFLHSWLQNVKSSFESKKMAQKFVKLAEQEIMILFLISFLVFVYFQIWCSGAQQGGFTIFYFTYFSTLTIIFYLNLFLLVQEHKTNFSCCFRLAFLLSSFCFCSWRSVNSYFFLLLVFHWLLNFRIHLFFTDFSYFLFINFVVEFKKISQ